MFIGFYFNIFKFSRYYAPTTGKFISRDPIGQNDQVNLYTYVANSPVMHTDPTGMIKKVLAETGERLARWTADALLLVLSPETANSPGEKTYEEDMVRGEKMDQEIMNPSGGALVVSMVLPIPGLGKKAAGERLVDGMTLKVDNALDIAEDFLGKGYKELSNGRFVSEVEGGLKQVRMGLNDILGKHGGGPHINFETFTKNEITGRIEKTSNIHVFIHE